MIQTSAAFRRDTQGIDGSISLSEIISALSYALDLTEGAVHGHALRSCLLGMRIAEEAKLPSDQTSSLYFALLLKDIGCSRSASRMSQVIGAEDRAAQAVLDSGDWPRHHKTSLSALKLLWNNVLPEAGRVSRVARFVRDGVARHQNISVLSNLRNDRGATILNKLGMDKIAADAVRSVEERWDGSGYPDSLKGEQIPLLARICAVAQHLDFTSATSGMQSAIDTLEQRSGTWFDPEFVHIARSLHRRRTLWNNCSPTDAEQDTRQAVLDLDSGRQHQVESSQIDRICEAFADVVDAKSHFTFSHSQGVADAAFGIAQTMGLSRDRAQLVRRAALLHDIGKLGVANTILDKKSQLSPEEWKAVYEHPRITRRILERIAPFREMAVIAGEHHEKLDGSGYPDHLKASELSIESRIVAVADVYAALSEDRPYRAGIELDETLSIMSKLIPNQLDESCFEALVSVVSTEREVPFSPASPVVNSPLRYPFKDAGFKNAAFESAL
jgi:HD-GYP domain-containing protein (c-di-GMP phosphodiesterase class II)